MFLLTFFDGLPFFDEKTPSKRGKEAKGETARRVDTRPTRPRGQEARGCFDVVYDGCNSGVFVSWLSATVLKSSKRLLWTRSNQSLRTCICVTAMSEGKARRNLRGSTDANLPWMKTLYTSKY